MVNYVCAKTVPDSTKLKGPKSKFPQGSMPLDPPSLPHALHTNMSLPPKKSHLPPPPPILAKTWGDRDRFDGPTPKTKETYYYQQIFEELFPACGQPDTIGCQSGPMPLIHQQGSLIV